MSKWSEIYRKQLSKVDSLDIFIADKLAYKKTLIDTIKKYSLINGKILEVGCGSGITSMFLGQSGYQVIGVDSDPDMVELATSIATQKKSGASFKIDDIRTLGTINGHFNVIFSNGVMEHFSDNEIVSVVNHHLSISNYVIVCVPSDYFSDDQKIYGDERFMSAKQWHALLSKTTGLIVEKFSFDYDMNVIGKPQFIGFVLSSL